MASRPSVICLSMNLRESKSIHLHLGSNLANGNLATEHAQRSLGMGCKYTSGILGLVSFQQKRIKVNDKIVSNEFQI